MTEKLADILKDKINAASLSWTGLIGGLAFPIEKYNQNKDRDQLSVFPAGTEVMGGETKENWEYQPLNPDGAKKSVIFFEESGTDILLNTGSNHESSLRLICWLNLKRIGESDNSNLKTDDYAIALINLLSGKSANVGAFNGIHIEVDAIPKRDKDIFSKYTFSQSQSQYLTFPYSFFALDLTVRYYYNHAC